MKYLLDVNVLVGVLRADSDLHDAARQWVTATAATSALIHVTPETLAAAVRVLTNDRIWVDTPSVEDATRAVAELVDGARLVVVGTSPTSWAEFQSIVSAVDLPHRHVPDALLAALARAMNAHLVTFDRSFTVYPGAQTQVL